MEEDNRPRYKGICPVCGAELWICKSIMLIEFGINIGHGTCHKCKNSLHLKFSEEKQGFEAKKKYNQLT